MKVIFLDIDGVMATHKSIKVGWEYSRKYKKRRLKYSSFIRDKYTLDRKCIKALNRLVVRTHAKVVVSSAWRYGSSVGYFQRLFKSKGFHGEIIGLTPEWKDYKELIGIKTINDLQLFWEQERGNEINLWLEWNKSKNVKSYIVIDDEVSDIEPLHKGKFIVTDIDKGFQGDDLLQEAIKKIEGE